MDRCETTPDYSRLSVGLGLRCTLCMVLRRTLRHTPVSVTSEGFPGRRQHRHVRFTLPEFVFPCSMGILQKTLRLAMAARAFGFQCTAHRVPNRESWRTSMHGNWFEAPGLKLTGLSILERMPRRFCLLPSDRLGWSLCQFRSVCPSHAFSRELRTANGSRWREWFRRPMSIHNPQLEPDFASWWTDTVAGLCPR